MRSKVLLIILACIGLTSCTIAINLTHTEGTASDIVDETQTNAPKVDPAVVFPAMALPGASAPVTVPQIPKDINGPAQPRLELKRKNKDWRRGLCNNRQYPRRHKIKDFSHRVKYG